MSRKGAGLRTGRRPQAVLSAVQCSTAAAGPGCRARRSLDGTLRCTSRFGNGAGGAPVPRHGNDGPQRHTDATAAGRRCVAGTAVARNATVGSQLSP